MEVLSYLELNIKFSKMGYSESEVYCMDLSEYLELGEQTFEDFYAQKFTPELIEKYFEGFKRTNDIYIDRIITIQNEYIFCDEYYFINWIKQENISQRILGFPRKLDEFITDCQRAGIKLKWRKQ